VLQVLPDASVWALPLADTTRWLPLATIGSPPSERSTFGLAYDAGRDVLMTFGGQTTDDEQVAWTADLHALRFSRPVRTTLLRRGVVDGDEPGLRLGQRVTEVAILADAGFSPDSVITSRATLAGAPALAPGRGDGDRHGHLGGSPMRDVDGDGRPDLVLRFDPAAMDGLGPDSVGTLLAPTTHFEACGRVALTAARRFEHAAARTGLDAAATELRLAPLGPSHGALRIAYALATGEPARLAVFDVAGRRVVERWLGSPTPGAQVLTFDSASLPAGLYLARLTQGARSVTARAVVLR